MVLVSYSGKEINAKIVFYGPGLCGKTTNLEYIYGSIPSGNRGKMVSMKTKTERTLFFDFLPLNLGELAGFKTRFLLYTVPGQVYYNATRKLVLKGVDAVIFVADSQRGKMDENIESFQNLRDNLSEHGLSLGEIPYVLQYNKRDLPDVHPLEDLERALNTEGVPSFEATATTGDGVFDTFKACSKLLLAKLSREIGAAVVDRGATGTTAAAAARAAAAAEAPPPAPAVEPEPQPEPKAPEPPPAPLEPTKQIRVGEQPAAAPTSKSRGLWRWFRKDEERLAAESAPEPEPTPAAEPVLERTPPPEPLSEPAPPPAPEPVLESPPAPAPEPIIESPPAPAPEPVREPPAAVEPEPVLEPPPPEPVLESPPAAEPEPIIESPLAPPPEPIIEPAPSPEPPPPPVPEPVIEQTTAPEPAADRSPPPPEPLRIERSPAAALTPPPREIPSEIRIERFPTEDWSPGDQPAPAGDVSEIVVPVMVPRSAIKDRLQIRLVLRIAQEQDAPDGKTPREAKPGEDSDAAASA